MPRLTRKEYEEIYIRTYPLVKSVVLKFVRRYHPIFQYQEVEDWMNEVFSKVPEAFNNFQGKSSPTTFIYSVANNVMLNEFRKRMARTKKEDGLPGTSDPDDPVAPNQETEQNHSETHAPLMGAGAGRALAINGEKVQNKAHLETLFKDLFEALAEIDARFPSILRLLREEYTDEEIGEKLSTPAKTIFRLRKQALSVLKALLKKRGINSVQDIF